MPFFAEMLDCLLKSANSGLQATLDAETARGSCRGCGGGVEPPIDVMEVDAASVLQSTRPTVSRVPLGTRRFSFGVLGW